MSLEDDFQNAQEQVKTLTTRPSNESLLQLYSLYKQGTAGDTEGKRPGMMDIKGRAKFDAWANLKGKDKETAMNEYVALVGKLLKG